MEKEIRFDTLDDKGPQRFDGPVAMTAAELHRDEVAALGDVRIEAEAREGAVAGEYEIAGRLDFTADLTCSRCVDPYPFAISAPFTVRYRPLPADSPAEDQELEIPEEDLDLEYFTERVIPIRALVNEQIQLAIPMKPLCEEKCLGLCPRCGANWNRTSCSCSGDETDERWAALKDIRDQLSGKKQN